MSRKTNETLCEHTFLRGAANVPTHSVICPFIVAEGSIAHEIISTPAFDHTTISDTGLLRASLPRILEDWNSFKEQLRFAIVIRTVLGLYL